MLKDIFADKTLKPSEKTKTILALVSEKKIRVEELLTFAKDAKDPLKATCIEAIEFATQKDTSLLDEKGFAFIVQSLSDKAPRIKWESAKVIANTCHLFSAKLDKAIAGLLTNSEHEGTVVRWSAATALAKIVALKTKHQQELIKTTKAIMDREEKNSIKKIYAEGLKKATK